MKLNSAQHARSAASRLDDVIDRSALEQAREGSGGRDIEEPLIGLGVQTWRGFYDYEVHLYLKQLFVLDWTNYALLCVLAFSIQVIVNHKYLGLNIYD